MGHTGRQAPEQGKVLGAPGLVFQAAPLGDFVAQGFVGHMEVRGALMDTICDQTGVWPTAWPRLVSAALRRVQAGAAPWGYKSRRVAVMDSMRKPRKP